MLTSRIRVESVSNSPAEADRLAPGDCDRSEKTVATLWNFSFIEKVHFATDGVLGSICLYVICQLLYLIA